MVSPVLGFFVLQPMLSPSCFNDLTDVLAQCTFMCACWRVNVHKSMSIQTFMCLDACLLLNGLLLCHIFYA